MSKQFNFNPKKGVIGTSNLNSLILSTVENNQTLIYQTDSNTWINTGTNKFIKQLNIDITGPKGDQGNNSNLTGITGPQGFIGNTYSLLGTTGPTGNQGPPGEGGGGSLPNGFSYGNILIATGANTTTYFSNGNTGISIGNQAGFTNQRDFSIAIGTSAGLSNQGTGSIAIGLFASSQNQSSNSVSIGTSSARTSQGPQSIALGFNSLNASSRNNSIGIGFNAGQNILNDSIAIGTSASFATPSSNSIAIGRNAGLNTIPRNAIGLGTAVFQSGRSNCFHAIGIGNSASVNRCGTGSISIGTSAGLNRTDLDTIGIGNFANYGEVNNSNSSYSIGIGNSACYQNVNNPLYCVAIGNNASYFGKSNGISIGNQAQGNTANSFATERMINIGTSSGWRSQTTDCIAIGLTAGYLNQGQGTEGAIAIGVNAGNTSQLDRTIIINSDINTTLDASDNNGFYVNPVRSLTAGSSNGMAYNPSTYEIFYDSNKTFIIDHPLNKDKYLVHCCLEGPEAGVYYRGKGEIKENQDYVEIELPDYVEKLATDFTIQITSIDIPRYLTTSEIENNKFKVFGDRGKFYWLLFGLRKEINVEVNKNEKILKGNGPYKFL